MILKGSYPQYICPVCLSYLKIALKLILQFEESQEKINKLLGKQKPKPDSDVDNDLYKYEFLEEENDIKKSIDVIDDSTPVEVIFGKNKFRLSDLIVVEEEKKEKCNFSGFLRNLGKEVTATFIDKDEENELPTTESSGVSITVLEKNRCLPVKELEFIEETEEIKFVIVEDDAVTAVEGEELIEIVADEDYPEVDNNDNVDHEGDSSEADDAEKTDFLGIDTANIDNFIIEHGKDSSDDKNKENNSISKVKRTRKRKKVEEQLTYPCELCKKIFPTPRHLKAHKRRTHSTNLMAYICDICGYKNNTLSGNLFYYNAYSLKFIKYGNDPCN